MKYKSLCSGSGGNAALLWTAGAAVLIDFAPGCQRDCCEALRALKMVSGSLDTVLVTHAHGDHINRNSLKVLQAEGFKVRCHPSVAREIKERHGCAHAGIIYPFEGEIPVGELKVRLVQVAHSPRCYTTAFIITGAPGQKASVFTDLHSFTEEQAALAADSGLLCLEANHDPELLKRYGHPGSEFHLPNIETARFLHAICALSRRQPQAVVLGHLSEDCNAPDLPEKEIRSFFKKNSTPVKFKTHVSPRYEHGAVLTIK
ncbi:MAG: MBL fold metallo-hydrolase [Elusimicrobiales bacterium]|nr:MBL fold metallo-hydrolase [Elusimicrobiales bacterium]